MKNKKFSSEEGRETILQFISIYIYHFSLSQDMNKVNSNQQTPTKQLKRMRARNSIQRREGHLHRGGDVWGGPGKMNRSLSLRIKTVEEHAERQGDVKKQVSKPMLTGRSTCGCSVASADIQKGLRSHTKHTWCSLIGHKDLLEMP